MGELGWLKACFSKLSLWEQGVCRSWQSTRDAIVSLQNVTKDTDELGVHGHGGVDVHVPVGADVREGVGLSWSTLVRVGLSFQFGRVQIMLTSSS